MKNHPSITLASASPRRRKLLALAGLDFNIMVPEIDETPFPGEDPRTFAERIAAAKTEAVSADGIILAADTIVVLNETILGKPADAADARKMLRALSGAEHEVITAVCIRDAERSRVFSVSTRVVFRTLTDDEIDDYIAGGEPMDKAGAYAIQGGAAHMVRSVQGSYTNVVGLPLCEVLECLDSF